MAAADMVVQGIGVEGKLQALVDGELEARDTREVEALLASDAANGSAMERGEQLAVNAVEPAVRHDEDQITGARLGRHDTPESP